jgi:imidazolonepropionase-like amidohydrolase
MRKLRETTDVQREGFAKAVEAGVRIAFGTDSGTYPHGMNANQFASMVKYGMTPMEAIRSATVVAAELLGWRDRVGALEPGLFADLVAVEGDVMNDVDLLTDVAFVMKSGRVVPAA